jgi:hypothetical protein
MGDDIIDLGGILKLEQVDKPHTVREGRFDTAGRRNRQPGFAGAAGARDGEEMHLLAQEVLAKDFKLAVASDQGHGV